MRFFIRWGIVLPCALLVLSACASNRFDTDKNDAGYYAGIRAFPLPDVSRSPNGNSTRPSGLGAVSNGGDSGTAFFGALISGISLAANSDYYRSSYVSGRCLCREQEDGFDVPCVNVRVSLIDDSGKELFLIDSADGEFMFPVASGRTYGLKVQHKKYAPLSPSSRMVRQGDEVVMRLIRRPVP